MKINNHFVAESQALITQMRGMKIKISMPAELTIGELRYFIDLILAQTDCD